MSGKNFVTDTFKISKGKNFGFRTGEALLDKFSPKPSPLPEAPDPTPTPIPGREEDQAKKKARRRTGRGRQQNILAGRLTAQRSNILSTRLG